LKKTGNGPYNRNTVVRVLAEEGDFSLFLRVTTRSKAQQASYFLGTAGSFFGQYNARGMKLAVYEFDIQRTAHRDIFL
jgi:glutamate synthase domain-containing protein 3